MIACKNILPYTTYFFKFTFIQICPKLDVAGKVSLPAAALPSRTNLPYKSTLLRLIWTDVTFSLNLHLPNFHLIVHQNVAFAISMKMWNIPSIYMLNMN